MSKRLSDVIEEHLSVLRAQGAANNTIKMARQSCDKLLLTTGNIGVGHVTDRHVDELFARMQEKGLAPNSLNILRAQLRSLFAYAIRRRYVNERRDPVSHIRAFKAPQKEKLRIPARDFPKLLDSCERPRDRAIVALGLYLFLRASEITPLTVRDLDLDAGEVKVRIQKTGQWDIMPICTELDGEMRRWLRAYSQDAGRALQPHWFLVPAQNSPRPRWDGGQCQWVSGFDDRALRPEAQLKGPARIVNERLAAAGYQTREGDRSAYTGIHTLRRSGARALFDRLSGEGYDGALKQVSAWLHHSSVTTTERYLGIGLDVEKRNREFRGRPMFPVDTSNVVELARPTAAGGA